MIDCYQKANLENWEQDIYENAVYFTATCFLGTGKYEKHQFKTEHDAITYAAANVRIRPWGIYAVCANQHDIVCGLVKNAKYV